MHRVEPLLVICLGEDQRYPVVERCDESVGFRRENGESPHPLTARRVLPVRWVQAPMSSIPAGQMQLRQALPRRVLGDHLSNLTGGTTIAGRSHFGRRDAQTASVNYIDCDAPRRTCEF